MLRIGIVGAENSHTVQISKVLNIQKKVPGCRVVCVWGEAPRYAKASAEAGQIPEIVKDPADMIGKIDAACVDHRHGMHHLPAARPLLEAKIPLFIDKPFCFRVKEGKEFLARAKKLKVPVCSFSTLPKQASFVEIQKELKKMGRIISVLSTGPCDIKSQYGGVSFYGIHQVDMVVRLLGNDVTHGQINLGKKNHTATLYSAGGAISTMNLFTEGYTAFHLSVIAEKGRIDRVITRDESPYLSGVKTFCRMFKTGKTDETAETMLMPVAVLEALEKSIKQKRKVKVPAIV